jgi:phasin family protein
MTTATKTASATATKSLEGIADFNKDTMDAMMMSSSMVAKGVEEMGKEIAAYTQIAMDKNMEAAKKMFAVKNMQDLMDVQAEWTKMAMDSFIAESAKLQDMSMQVSTEAVEPVSKQFSSVVEKLAEPFAA